MDIRTVKIEVFVPESHLSAIRRALWDADVGHIGNYDHCLSYAPVTSCWRPLNGTHPYLGSQGQTSVEPEYKIEATCFAEQVDAAVASIKAAHPYEEPVINVIPLLCTGL